MKYMTIHMILGVILILFGISMILKTFGVDIPLIKPFFALLLIYAGVMFIIDSKSPEKSYRHYYASDTERTIVFGSEAIYASSLKQDKPVTVNLNTVFGKGTLHLDPSIPTMIKINSAFSNVQLPQETMVVLGTHVYKNYQGEQQPQITLYANVVFGNLLVT